MFIIFDHVKIQGCLSSDIGGLGSWSLVVHDSIGPALATWNCPINARHAEHENLAVSSATESKGIQGHCTAVA